MRVHVSLLIAEKTDQWRTYNEKSISLDDKRVHVDIEKLLLDLKQTNDFIKETRKTFSDHKLIEVSYDDLVQDQEKTLKSILNFLDLPPTTVESHM